MSFFCTSCKKFFNKEDWMLDMECPECGKGTLKDGRLKDAYRIKD